MLSLLALAVAPAARAQSDWPTERPPRPLPAQGRQLSAVPDEDAAERAAGDRGVASRAAGRQPAADRPRRRRAGSRRPSRASRTSRRRCSTRARRQERRADCTTIDSIGGAIGAGAGSDLTFINAAVMKDSLGLALDLVSDLARNPAFAPEEIERQRQQILSGLKVSYDDPGLPGRRGLRSAGLRVPSVRQAGFRDARNRLPRSRARICWRFTSDGSAPNNAILAIVGDVTAEEAFAGAERAFGGWERVDLPDAQADEPPRADPPRRHRRSAGCGPDRDPRRQHRPCRGAQKDYLALDIATKILGGEGGNRLHRVLRSERRPHVRRLRRSARAQGHREHHRRDRHALGEDRRSAAADRRRDLQAAASAGAAARAQRRAGIPHRQLSADDRDARRDRAPGAERGVLRPRPERAAGLPRAREQDHGGRHPARGAAVSASRSTRDRAGRGCLGHHETACRVSASIEVERISIADLDLSSPDLRRHAAPVTGGGRIEPVVFRSSTLPDAQVTGRPAEAAGVRDLIDRAVAAKGGVDVLRSIRTSEGAGHNGRPIEGTRHRVSEHHLHQVSRRVPQRGTAARLAGWSRSSAPERHGSRTRPACTTRRRRCSTRCAARCSATSCRCSWRSPTASWRQSVSTTSSEAGRQLPALEVALPGASPLTLVFDPATTLVLRGALRRERRRPERRGQRGGIYADYRDVHGLKVAFSTEVRREGAPGLARDAAQLRNQRAASIPPCSSSPVDRRRRSSVRVMISCGEPSGDSVRRRARDASCSAPTPRRSITGFGGDRLAAAGASLVGDFSRPVGHRASRSRARRAAHLRDLPPAGPGRRGDIGPTCSSRSIFPISTFVLARAIRKLGVPVVYYISPQLWAWRRGRMKTMRRIADRVLVIFPFEAADLRAGRRAGPVGRTPAARRGGHAAAPRCVSDAPAGSTPAGRWSRCCPGSRRNEVARDPARPRARREPDSRADSGGAVRRRSRTASWTTASSNRSRS